MGDFVTLLCVISALMCFFALTKGDFLCIIDIVLQQGYNTTC